MVASTPSSAHALITKRERGSERERGGEIKEQEGDDENESERA